MLVGVLALIVFGLLLPGAFHHHDGHEVCWFCTTAAVAVVATLVITTVAPLGNAPLPNTAVPAPSWFLWVVRHHRGPPPGL